MHAKKFLKQLADPCEDLAVRCVAARALYWNYSFDFMDHDASFSQITAREFILARGIQTLLDLALTGFIAAPPVTQAYHYEDQLQVCAIDHELELALFQDDSIDTLVALPPHTFSHEGMHPINQPEAVTLRRLAIEVLSEVCS